MKITKKPFSLDPQLGTLKDNPTTQAKAANWTVLAKELKVIKREIIAIYRNSEYA